MTASDDPDTGSGKGGTLGTPTTDTKMSPPGEDDNMVVSGGGVADTAEEDGATAAGEDGLG